MLCRIYNSIYGLYAIIFSNIVLFPVVTTKYVTRILLRDKNHSWVRTMLFDVIDGATEEDNGF